MLNTPANISRSRLQVPLLMDDDTIAFGEEEEAAQNTDKLKYI